MKKIAENLDQMLTDFREQLGMRTLCLEAATLALGSFLIMATIQQVTGVMPATEKISLIFWSFKLPFAVSRIWDPLLFMPFFFLTYFLNRRIVATRKWRNWEAIDDSFLCFIGECSILVFAGGLLFGAVYVVPFLIIAPVTLIAFLFLVAIAGLIWHFINSLWNKSIDHFIEKPGTNGPVGE